jgi:DNA (cytosine-5)-methyltransferase 1
MEFVRVVEFVRPSVFVLENVPQFLKTRRFALLRGMTKTGRRLEEYSLVHAVLNAADFGVPQRRKRAVVIGSRIGEPQLPTPTHGFEGGEEWVGLREALAGIPFEVPSMTLPERAREDGVPGPFKANEIHVGRNPTDLSLRRYDQVPPGGNRFDLERSLLPPCWLDRESGSTDVMGRLEWDKPALTIRTEFFKPEKGRYLHPQWDPDDPTKRINRPLSHWEAARIQCFPDDFVWCGTKTEIARQIGNAVPVGLAKAIAEEVVGLLA